ncbi:hypothetical protein [Singulisphaera sp. PoT]|uniref:hypothetical protein n=1 Tax=Singulisphaera sp. PoT TaxID=3411797 RepID=UPI003BF5B17F
MRSLRTLLGLTLLSGAACCLSGCGGSSISEGVPADVDMTKSYTPPASVNIMAPSDSKKAAKATKAARAAAKSAPAAEEPASQ